MAYLTPEQIEEWREEAQFQHDRYLRDGTGIGTVLALTQARLLRTLTELTRLRDGDGCSDTGRNPDTPVSVEAELAGTGARGGRPVGRSPVRRARGASGATAATSEPRELPPAGRRRRRIPPMIRAIGAIDDRLGLATDNGIPWHVPADVEHFRTSVASGDVLMGYATYEEFERPLPDCINFVATRRARTPPRIRARRRSGLVPHR